MSSSAPLGAITGIGDQYQFATSASPTTFTTLNGVDSIKLSGDKVSTLSTLTMASTDGIMTYLGGTQNPGTFDISGFWLPGDTTQTALLAVKTAAQPVAMKISYGSANSASFVGIVESFSPSLPLDKLATFSLKGQISGPITYV